MPLEQVVSNILAAEAELEIEYQRTKTEAEAFQSFRQQVMEIKSAQPRSDGGTTIRRSLSARTVAQHPPPCKQVRQAYRDTILSMPHYAEEYDEPLSEHMAVEFGEELTVSLLENAQLTPLLKEEVAAASQQASQQRVKFLSQLDTESAELDTARTSLRDLPICTKNQKTEQPQGRDFDELKELYDALHTAKNRCDKIVKARQQSLQSNNQIRSGTSSISALQPYLYSDLDVTYPILADVAEYCLHLRWMKNHIEQAFTVIR